MMINLVSPQSTTLCLRNYFAMTNSHLDLITEYTSNGVTAFGLADAKLARHTLCEEFEALHKSEFLAIRDHIPEKQFPIIAKTQ